jgi:uncharacterized membrane protein YkvA (DUF1232 family)
MDKKQKDRKKELGKKGYRRFESKASKYMQDADKAKKLLKDAKEKAERKKNILDDAWCRVQLVFNLFEDWIKGNYRAIPYRSIIMITVAILYFVIPTDILPDFIIGLGYGDDIAVLSFVFNQIGKDINDYKVWRQENIQEDQG